VSALQARSLDAVLVYRSNALASPVTLKENEIVELKDELAFAEQPFAVAKESGLPRIDEEIRQLSGDSESEGKIRGIGIPVGTQLTIVSRCRLGLEGLFSWALIVCHLCAILGVLIMKTPA
jgi:hypothetical protein